jgi:hypothetical protein
MLFYKGLIMINENFSSGYNAGLNALEDISSINENLNHEILAGLLSSIMNCIYFYAPSEKAASDLVQFAVDYAKEENAKIGMNLPKGA